MRRSAGHRECSDEDKDKDKERTKKMADKEEVTVKPKRVSTFLGEWTVWRVYKGDRRVAAFTDQDTANLMAANIRACGE